MGDQEKTIDFQSMIYEKAVIPSLKCANKHIDKGFALQCGVSDCSNIKHYAKRLEVFFLEKRDWLKSIYWNNDQGRKEKLDLHKVASVLCRSIIGLKPFSFDAQKAEDYIIKNGKENDIDWLVKNYFINYKVAFDSALALTLFDFLTRLDNDKKKNELAIDLIRKIGIETKMDYYDDPFQQTHEIFYNSIVLHLAINDLVGRDFDYLAYGAIFFQLQQYNYVKFENEVLKKKLS